MNIVVSTKHMLSDATYLKKDNVTVGMSLAEFFYKGSYQTIIWNSQKYHNSQLIHDYTIINVIISSSFQSYCFGDVEKGQSIITADNDADKRPVVNDKFFFDESKTLVTYKGTPKNKTK